MSRELTDELNRKAGEALGWSKEKPYWSDRYVWYKGDGQYDWVNKWNPYSDWNDAAVLLDAIKDNETERAKFDDSLEQNYFVSELTPEIVTRHFLEAKGVNVDV
jgi:hypothetical protein